MKHIFISTILLFASIALHAQGIYTKVTKYDKFDDVVWEKNLKTLITTTDTTIVIETKGQKPEQYEVFEEFSFFSGTRENLVNLVADVYGYESEYIGFPPKCFEEMMSEIAKNTNGGPINPEDDEKVQKMIVDGLKKRMDDFPVIRFRTVSKYQYSFMYETDMVWVRYKDGSRIIYTK